jgi:hypothetical protein
MFTVSLAHYLARRDQLLDRQGDIRQVRPSTFGGLLIG